jgi:hypothetical protein
MLRFLLGMVSSLLPARFRARYAWAFASAGNAIASGAVELLACLVLLIYRYFVFANLQLSGISTEATAKAAEAGGETAVMGMGMFVLAEYLIQPLTLLLVYFAIEGLARGAAAIASGEVVASLPLQLLGLAYGKAAAVQQERELGPPVEDLVQPGSGDFALVIASCRPKPWTNMTTIAYEDRLFELVRAESACPPRRWVYVLRKRPEGKVVRGGIYQYSPDELLPNADAAVAKSS